MKTLSNSFFEALGEDGAEAALGVIKDAAFTSGVDEEPSPRAAAYVEGGEWDARTLLGLTLVDEDACFYAMPNMKDSAFPSADTYSRFCGRANCVATTHKKGKGWLPENERRPGWYVSAGAANQGVLKELRFPAAANGGPLTSQAQMALVDPADPFKMSIG